MTFYGVVFYRFKRAINETLFFFKEITNLLGIVFYLEMVSDRVPASSLGIPKLCMRESFV